MSLNLVASEALEELRQKSRKALYQRDPEAWYADVLDGYWWSKQKEVVWAFADPGKPSSQVVVKSCNGVGKTRLAADLTTWLVACFDPMDLTVIMTAPVFSQIRTGLFRYVADLYGKAKENHVILPGRITAEPTLKVARPGGGPDKDVVQAKRPADSNLISSFQGIHDGIVAVVMDEAGGLPEDLWIGANAVTTNEVAKILAIGNPDSLHTAFHRRFTDRDRYREWQPFTISAYDSPNFTGEAIHPDPVKDRRIKSLLVQRSWAEMMERQAHPNVVRAKVHGEFPEDDASAFFTQETMNRAYDTEIDNPGGHRWLGVDLAFTGSDKSVAYLNVGGRIRKVGSWLHQDDMMEATRGIHQLALKHAVDEVRVDASGAGRGVYSLLVSQEEFAADYVVVGVQGGHSSPDNKQWAQARAWHFDSFRSKMQRGLIDLDPDDEDLRTEMTVQPFEVNDRGAIQITPKPKMRAKGLESPDHLDAAIYSANDLSEVAGDPEAPQPGDRVVMDPAELGKSLEDWYGLPGDPF